MPIDSRAGTRAILLLQCSFGDCVVQPSFCKRLGKLVHYNARVPVSWRPPLHPVMAVPVSLAAKSYATQQCKYTEQSWWSTSRLSHASNRCDFPDLLPRVQAGRLRAGAAQAGRRRVGAARRSAARCASKVSSSLPCSHLFLPHEDAQGGCCLHDKCVRQIT